MRRFVILLCLLAQPAFALERTEFAAQGDLIGRIEKHVVQKEDTLYDVARRYKVSFVSLLAANPGVDVWVPKVGHELVVPNLHILPPAKRSGVVINLSELRLFYFTADKIYSYPIGIGREGWQTPVGSTTITLKRKDPVWIPPASIRKENPDLPAVVPAGPNNPLGAHALNLGWPSYTIHGTDKPDGIGRRSSHGCIRMYPEDIAELFGMVTVGTKVTVVDTSYKLGWRNEALYLEVNPTQEQSDAIMEYEHVVPLDVPGLEEKIGQAVKDKGVEVDWELVKKVEVARTGIPVAIAGDAPREKAAPVAQPEAAPPPRPREDRLMKPIPLGPVPAEEEDETDDTDDSRWKDLIDLREPKDKPAPEPSRGRTTVYWR